MNEIVGNTVRQLRPRVKKPILIFGAGQVAQVFAAYLEENDYAVEAFVVDAEHMTDALILGIPVVAMDQVEKLFPPQDYRFTVGMSFRGLNAPRAGKFLAMKALGYEPLTFIDRRASVDPSAMVGEGAFVMDENTVQPFAGIGANTILWSGCHVGHHTQIGAHVFVASHAVVGGAVSVGDFSFLGINAAVRDNVKVGERCVIGAATLILSDCEADGVYQGQATERSRVPSSRLRGI